jgi:hypothetical protein
MRKRGLFARRLTDLLAMEMIGDGVLALLVPTEHMNTWISGPQRWRDLGNYFAERPGLTRLAGTVEICVAVWWVLRSRQR